VKRALLATLLVLLSTSASRPARADDEAARNSYRVVLDRVVLEPSALTGYRLRLYVSALALQGQILDLTDPKSIKLYIGAGEKKVPYALGTYDATPSETAIVILVQASLDYTEALGMIADSIDHDVLTALPDRTQIAVLSFGDTAASGKLEPIKQVRGKVPLATDNSAGDPTLLDSVDRALMLLKRAKTTPEGQPLRKIIVVVGDGRDLSGDKERVTRTGTRASKEGVRIHTIAFSPNDVRRPMLALGELSKRSFGTFRWVRKDSPDSWKAAFEQLRDEINKQYVLTYFVDPSEEVAGRKIHIVTVGRTEATSNELKVGDPMCGANACTTGYCAVDHCVQYKGGGGRGVLGWLLLVGGVGLGLVLLLGVIGFFITKAQQAKIQYPPGYQPGMPVQPGMPLQPGVYPGVQPPMPGMPPQTAPPKKQKKSKKGQPQVVPGMLPSGRPIPALLITSGPRTGERHLLRNGYLIGKQPGCDLIIEDGYTSSQHAQIGMDEHGMCKLYDRGSTNGTYVNGVRITESVLQHGITIRIGSTEIRFLAE
jgi:hypothetical protein